MTKVTCLNDLEENARKPDLCFFTVSISGGGAERMLLYLADYFAKKGYVVDLVVCKSSPEKTIEKLLPEDVRFVCLDSKRTLLSIRAYLEYLRKTKPKVVMSTIIRANIIAGFTKILGAPKHRLVIRSEISLTLWRDPYQTIQSRWFLVPLALLSYPFANKYIAISQGVSEQFKWIIGSRKKVYQIYNPVIRSDFKHNMQQSHDYPSTIRKDIPIILAASRLAPEKDIPTLLRAYKKVLQKKDCQLIILGDGHIRQALEILVEEMRLKGKVHFLGFKDNVLPYMKNADVFVLSSLTEGLANSLVEALACGAKVVSTDCLHGPKEVLDNGRFGSLVSVGDDEKMSESILNALRSSRKEMSIELEQHLNKFRMECVGPQYETVLMSE